MNFKEAYTRYFVNAPVINRLIIINVVCFLVTYVFVGLFKINFNFFRSFLGFPNDIVEYIKEPWTIITYAFLHKGYRHIIYNMLFLYFFGQVFLNIHNGRRFLNVYFLGILFGALAYMLAYAIFPVFSGVYGNMVGASAAVNAVMVAATIQSPNKTFQLMFIPVKLKLWWLCVGMLVLDLMQLQSGNAGGHFAHLGGALVGCLYMTQLQKGNDIGAPIEKFMDWMVGLFKPSEKTNLKTVHKTKQTSKTKPKRSKNPNQAQIDTILDKISKSGYESLSKKEKETLFKAGKQ